MTSTIACEPDQVAAWLESSPDTIIRHDRSYPRPEHLPHDAPAIPTCLKCGSTDDHVAKREVIFLDKVEAGFDTEPATVAEWQLMTHLRERADIVAGALDWQPDREVAVGMAEPLGHLGSGLPDAPSDAPVVGRVMHTAPLDDDYVELWNVSCAACGTRLAEYDEMGWAVVDPTTGVLTSTKPPTPATKEWPFDQHMVLHHARRFARRGSVTAEAVADEVMTYGLDCSTEHVVRTLSEAGWLVLGDGSWTQPPEVEQADGK